MCVMNECLHFSANICVDLNYFEKKWMNSTRGPEQMKEWVEDFFLYIFDMETVLLQY